MNISVAPSYTTCDEKPIKLLGIGTGFFSRQAGIKERSNGQHEKPQ
jgi:hypothetical protein